MKGQLWSDPPWECLAELDEELLEVSMNEISSPQLSPVLFHTLFQLQSQHQASGHL